MVTVSTDEFLREVMPYCPDAMELVALNAIRNACIEFCRVSTIHRIDMDAVSGVADQAEYTIVVPDATQLVVPIQLSYSGLRLYPKTVEELAVIFHYQDWTQAEGQPRYYTQITPDTITLAPFPTESTADALTGRIALMPTRDATTVYDELYNRYVEEIAMGARSRLHYTPGTTYFDMTLAEYCKTRFQETIANARARANMGNTRAAMRVMPRRF